MYKVEVFVDNRWAHYSWARKEDDARKKFDKMKKKWATCRVIYKGKIIMISVE